MLTIFIIPVCTTILLFACIVSFNNYKQEYSSLTNSIWLTSWMIISTLFLSLIIGGLIDKFMIGTNIPYDSTHTITFDRNSFNDTTFITEDGEKIQTKDDRITLHLISKDSNETPHADLYKTYGPISGIVIQRWDIWLDDTLNNIIYDTDNGKNNSSGNDNTENKFIGPVGSIVENVIQ